MKKLKFTYQLKQLCNRVGKAKKWVLEFVTKDPSINPLMGWETSSDTLGGNFEFESKEKAIEYAKNNNISYTVIQPKKKEFVIKSYADNFLKIRYVA